MTSVLVMHHLDGSKCLSRLDTSRSLGAQWCQQIGTCISHIPDRRFHERDIGIGTILCSSGDANAQRAWKPLLIALEPHLHELALAVGATGDRAVEARRHVLLHNLQHHGQL